MPKRQIVKIDEEKCTGCGLCVPSCAEGALEIVDGKARIVKEIYCDGLGACLGECPEDAITIEEREADAFDEEATAEHLAQTQPAPQAAECTGGCPGAMLRTFAVGATDAAPTPPSASGASAQSQLGHWPVQITLLPPTGDIWKDADVLICADCVPFAMPDFHERLLAKKTVAVGCPKLDNLDAYTEKLAGVFANNTIRSVTVARMEVPCCTGILIATKKALERAGKREIEFHDLTIGIKGQILAEA
jgi:Pyruvate/2-oxoacid:ferredoxin oxidoreductase delta subunit